MFTSLEARIVPMRNLISFLFMLLCSVSLAQQPDTVEQFLANKDIPAKVKVDRLNSLARDLAYVHPLQGAEFSYRALQLSQEADYPSGMAYALRAIASSLLTEERIYLCMKNLQRSLQLFKTIDDSTGIAGCYISLGHLYRRLQDRDQELLYHSKAFDFFSRKGSPERIGVTTHNLGETYYYRGEYKRATELTERAIAINDSLRNFTVLSACYRVMGNIKLAQNDKEGAAYWYNKTLSISELLGEGSQKVATVDALINLARLASEKNQDEQALKNLQRAFTIAKENRLFNYTQPIYEAIIENHSKRGALQELRRTINDYRITAQELSNVETEVMFRFTETMFRVDSLENTANELVERNRTQQNLIEEKNSRTRMTVIFLISLLVLSIVLTYNVVKLRKANVLLTEQRAMVRRQNQQLEELNGLKNKFLSILSHDIKAPLQGLKSYVGLLKTGGELISRGQLIQFGTELEQQLEDTTKMADNLILWAKLQMKKAQTQPQSITIGPEIEEVIRLYETAAKAKNLKLQYRGAVDEIVWADPNQYSFIVRNLVYNAIKYSHAGDSIEISSRSQGATSILSVTDSGEGISKETIEALYLNTPIESQLGTTGEEGTGLGLRICLEFAQLNRGRLTIKNNPAGKGTCFLLELPHP